MISVNLAFNGYVGLSTDQKPTEDVNNGSRFYEMNTQKNYMFDAENAQWIEQPAEGGGSTSEAFIVTIGDSGSETTAEEVIDAFMSGIGVWVHGPNQDSYDALTKISWTDDSFTAYFGSNQATADSDGYLVWYDG